MNFIAKCAVVLTSCFCFTAYAADMAPDALVKDVTQEVTAIVKQDKEIQQGNQKKAYELVEAKVLPHFDFTRMTSLAVGRNWSKATPEQQKALINEFKVLLVRTYSSALSTYRDQVIEFKPFRAQPNDTESTVRTQVIQPGRQPVGIDYAMQKTAEGWKVYDVTVGGVSLVTNYRESFSNEIKSSGIDGLIKTLAAKNSKSSGETNIKVEKK